jgi:hypothetical protein
VELAEGTCIADRYEVLGELGRGAMANVYVVRHRELGTVHALKVLQLPTPAIRDRLRAEGQIQGALRHPNVVSVTDLVEVDGSPGLVMELVRGPSLDRLLREARPDLAHARALGAQILLGVQAAHRAGRVHRDLKPANVLIDVDDGAVSAKVADFGLAKVLAPDDQGTTATRTGSTLGTPAYMAPEQVRDARSVDERADVFSLGALLYELLTGERAFPGGDVMTVFDAIRDGRVRPIEELRPEVPPALAAAVVRALAPDREARTPSVDALLAAWTEGRGAEAARHAWSPEWVARVAAMATAAAPAQPRSAGSSSTWGDAGSVDAPPPVAVVAWEETVPPAPSPIRRASRLLLVGGAAAVAAFVVALGGGLALLVLLAVGWLQIGEDVPDYEPVSSIAPAPEVDPELAAGRLDRVLAAREAALGPLAGAEDRCADPRPCLELAAAQLWVDDARAWQWLERAAAQSRGRGAVERLAERLQAVSVEGLDDDVARKLSRASADPLAVLVVGQLGGVDPAARRAMLDERCRDRPAEHGACLLLARLEARRGGWARATELVDAVLAVDPGHTPALVVRAELALAVGSRDAGLRAAERTPDDLLSARVRAAAHRAAADAADPRDRPPDEPRAAVAFHTGRAEAALGLGFVAEAREELGKAYDAGHPLDTLPAAWLHGELALLADDPTLLSEAGARLRVLAAEPVAPLERARLVNRADLLDGVAAVRTGDARGLEKARQAVAARPGGETWLRVLAALEEAARGVTPPVIPTESCLPELLQARWLDDTGAPEATARLRALAAGEGSCGAFGVERWARAEAWVRWAVRRKADGADADARAGLDAYGALVAGFEPPFVSRAEALRSTLDGL